MDSVIQNDQSCKTIRPIHWKRFVHDISSKRVVPLLGPELLVTEIDGETISFYEYVAKKVLAHFQFDPDDAGSIQSVSDVAYHLHKRNYDVEDVYYCIDDVIHSRKWEIPPALLKLAEIEPLDLFVSLTPDNLMEDALNRVRFNGEKRTRVLSFSPEAELLDLPDAYGNKREDVPTVYKLFGDSRMKPDFAVTEEDILKYIYSLQSKDLRPVNLFDVLRDRWLMFLGYSMENWLVRILFCAAKTEALFSASGAKGVVANKKSREDISLLPFLDRNNTLLYDEGDGIKFVDELHEKYLEENPKDIRQGSASGKNDPASSELFNECMVFLSYAREDQAAVEKIREELNRQGISVWMDSHQISGGDDFKIEIENQIDNCQIFIPVISRNSTVMDKRFYRMEWKMAQEESRKWPENYPFIQPVVIDDTTPESDNIPREFGRYHWNDFPDGAVSPQFVKAIKRTLERQRRRQK